TKFQADAFEVALGSRFHDELSGGVFAGESNLVNVHVTADGSARRRTIAWNDVDHSIGQSGLLSQLRHPESRERRLLSRLENNRPASRQRRAPLPGLHQQREIPGNDLTDDADRFVAGVAKIIALYRDRLAVILVGPAGIVAVALDGHRQVDIKRITVRFA